MFLGDVVPELDGEQCDLFAVAPESAQDDYVNMNTGVMLMNTARLRESLPAFRDYILTNLAELERESWDEAAYRWFYRNADGPLWDRLPPELNWKPYWGRFDAAKIIHFHGPKPYQRNYIDSHWPELKRLATGESLIRRLLVMTGRSACRERGTAPPRTADTPACSAMSLPIGVTFAGSTVARETRSRAKIVLRQLAQLRSRDRFDIRAACARPLEHLRLLLRARQDRAEPIAIRAHRLLDRGEHRLPRAMEFFFGDAIARQIVGLLK